MIKLFFNSVSWFKTKDEYFRWFSKYTPGNTGVWENIVMVDSIEKSDAVVFFNNSNIPKIESKIIIQVRREPDLIQIFKKSKNAHIFIDYENMYHASTWFLDKNYDELLNFSKKEKTKKVSAIFSSKYKFRNDIMKNISKNTNIVDFYGRGIKGIVNESHFLGELNHNSNCKYRGLINYEKSIAIENSCQKNYFTEKLIDCFVCETLPIYLGCPNIFDFFPEDSIRIIKNARDEKDLKEIIEAPVTQKEKNAILASKSLVMKKYNIWPTLQKAIKEGT